jgi:hypothetical protein|tara:strand:+ start:483 stop:770 length:288 start_codon:yes stop_codon:yes gene_type:complete
MAQRGRKKKISQFKVGDKVRSAEQIGIWDLVWYKEGDTTCAIQNHKTRALTKVSQLSLIVEDEEGEKLPIPIATDKEWMKQAKDHLEKIKTEGYE